jgi:3-methyladenine DNA glycosylase/8-oxoguanine DNA glycosylase
VRRFGAQPGIGPWTLGVLRGYGLGEADAEIVGDLHLPHLVCWALAGEAPGSDARMLELLEPFRGHRFRVVRLLFFAGISVPRLKTPVAPPRSHG